MDARFLKGWELLVLTGKDKEVMEKARAAGKTPYQLWLEANPDSQELPDNVTQIRRSN